ncbi:MAG: carbohydrate ABC transporter permease [Candidatus Limnocylindria bacterium]
MTTIGPQAQAQVAVPPRPRPLEGGSRVELVLMHAAFFVIAAFFLAPFVWLFTAAFDAQAQAYIRWPQQLTLDNFVQIFERYAFATALQNSVFVAVSTMLLTVCVVSLAGYSLSRIELRQKAWITYGILLLQTMPLSATMVPIYGLARELGLRNSYLGLILIHAAIELPFLVWLMKGFFDSVPRHLEEAAWLDGRTKFRALFEIVLPVARPGIAVAAGLSFLGAWAEVLMVLILVDQQAMKTIPLAFYETFRTAGGYTEVQYGLVAAMAVLYVVPVMAVFFATRRLMVRGLMGSTRGL